MSFELANTLGSQRVPFLFISDYEAQNVEVIRLDVLEALDIEFSIEKEFIPKKHSHTLNFSPLAFVAYKKKFDAVIEKIKAGETYLLNLTQATKVSSPLSLKEMYALANAAYKLRYKDEFVCFSPETFVKIMDDTIHTYPMKGTIDASIENAKEKILLDKKELAEHIMIVDLLRNDLSMVASEVKVEKFRYVESIEAGSKKLLQVSSHICAKLEKNWHEKIGDILSKLLPAGSITGAPKKSTMEIIKSIEGYERAHFSGVFGLFDGSSFESGVMIRFIEKRADGYLYKSGGGITLDSDPLLEYKEYQDKIYLP